ncbi:hypothetical protein STRTUCAR8_07029, partial [Streptomyces turgidiscabies Car8]
MPSGGRRSGAWVVAGCGAVGGWSR